MASPDPPTTLFAANDVPMASQVFPTLTTAWRPLEQMGRAAVALLVAQLRGETVSGTVLPTALVVRSSSGPTPGG